MGLEILPNELLIECFNYLDGIDIYYAFDRLNYRFHTLIRNLPLYVNLCNAKKSKFDRVALEIFKNRQIRKQIYSIQLSNENICQKFLSFSLRYFSNLRSFTLVECTNEDLIHLSSMLLLLSQLSCFCLIDCKVEIRKHLFFSRKSQPQILTLPNVFWKHQLICDISSVISLTINHCHLEEFHQILNTAHRLKYLSVNVILRNNAFDNDEDDKYSGDISHVIHLKQLIILEFTHTVNDLVMILQRTPNVKSLTIKACSDKNVIDANRWQDLIASSLSHLKIFNFHFVHYYESKNFDAHGTFKHFQTDFWQKQHHWYTEYSFDKDGGEIYTIPYLLNKYSVSANTVRYHNEELINDRHTFDNVTNLTIRCDALTDKEQYNFSHVTSLSFDIPWGARLETFVTEKHVETLKTIVNLDNVKHLRIPTGCVVETSSVLLNILKQAPNISSLSIDSDRIIPLLSDNELSNYLKKIIKKLDVATYCYINEPFSHGWDNVSRSDILTLLGRKNGPASPFDDLCKINELWDIFSNIEQIKCHVEKRDSIVFLMKHLPKLSRMDIWSRNVPFRTEVPYLEEEASKLNMKITTNINPPTYQVLAVWIVRNSQISRLRC